MPPRGIYGHNHGTSPPQEAGRAGRARSGQDDRMREEEVDLARRIADLDRRIQRLSDYIDDVTIGDDKDEISVDSYTRLVSLYGQLVSRLGRLMRDQQQLGGGEDSELDRAIDAALDMASDILGVEL